MGQEQSLIDPNAELPKSTMSWPEIFSLLGHIYDMNQKTISYSISTHFIFSILILIAKERAVALWLEAHFAQFVADDVESIPSMEVSKAIQVYYLLLIVLMKLLFYSLFLVFNFFLKNLENFWTNCKHW
jgi:uncharacterized membrane protein YGL010W